MKNLQFLDSLFFNKNLKLTDMQKGLTNKNFLLTMDDEQFVLRVPLQDAQNIVNRHHETLALEAIKDANIDVETIYYDEISGYKVTRYLEHAKTYQECDDPEKIVRVAKLMKKFHSLNKTVDTYFDPIKRLQQYKSHVCNPLYEFDGLDDILKQIETMEHHYTLCHNDWVDGNILFVDDQTYLIDYEYAANNDPLFDVMSFLSENNIYDETLRQRFYDAYFDHFDEETEKNLCLYEALEDALWCYWAMMMYESRKENIYKEIAKDKIDGYHAVIKKLKK